MEEVLAKYFSGNVTEEERKQVETWRSENEDNASEFYQFKQVWSDSNVPDVDVNSALNSVLNQIEITEDDTVIPIDSSSAPNYNFSNFLRYAAVVILAAGLTFVYFQRDAFNSENQIVAVSGDDISEVNLPDGSIVTLHRNSTLEYDQDFAGNIRNVTLNGKAFFDVKRDVKRPFIVTTINSEVEVLGTSFMVECNPEILKTEVVVVTGKVGVTNKSEALTNENLRVELTPGQVVSITDNRSDFKVKSTQEINFLSWKTGVFSFENERLENVIELLEDVYGISVKLSDDNINNCRLTAKFNKDSFEDILNIIAATYGFEANKIRADKYELKGTGCINVN